MTGSQSKVINRAEVVDKNFIEFVKNYQPVEPKQSLEINGLTADKLLQLFESQIQSRQLDLMARILKLENKVFYTIGSSGHEGNVMLGDLSDTLILHFYITARVV